MPRISPLFARITFESYSQELPPRTTLRGLSLVNSSLLAVVSDSIKELLAIFILHVIYTEAPNKILKTSTNLLLLKRII